MIEPCYKHVIYLSKTKEAENLQNYISCRIYENVFDYEEIGLSFPQGSEFCKPSWYAFAYILDERKYMLAKLKYGI